MAYGAIARTRTPRGAGPRRSRPLQLREPLLIEAQDVRELRDSILRGGLSVVREIPQDVIELAKVGQQHLAVVVVPGGGAGRRTDRCIVGRATAWGSRRRHRGGTGKPR
jgi:hypothetical protein